MRRAIFQLPWGKVPEPNTLSEFLLTFTVIFVFLFALGSSIQAQDAEALHAEENGQAGQEAAREHEGADSGPSWRQASSGGSSQGRISIPSREAYQLN